MASDTNPAPAIGVKMTSEQIAAVDLLTATRRGEKSLSGPAGSGKTTIIKAIAERRVDVAVVAFTNAAAKVLRTKGLDATTIHRKFYVPEDVVDARGKKYTKFIPAFEWDGALPVGKLRHVTTIVVDEASMVSGWMVYHLRQMCDELILVGDGNQLPPVGDKRSPRGYFNTLTHTAKLVAVHRQTSGNPALAMATQLRQGQIDPLSHQVVSGFAPGAGTKLSSIIHDLDTAKKTWRVITFTNRTRHAMNSRVRGYYGNTENFAPQPGELLISLDAYDDRIVNGTFLEVVSSDFPSGLPIERATLFPTVKVRLLDEPDQDAVELPISMTAYLDGFPEHADTRKKLVSLLYEESTQKPSRYATVNFGYAVTCHKAQGSEFDHVFLVDERAVQYAVAKKEADETDAADPLTGIEAARRWTYTAMTRTRAGLTVIPRGAVR
jgi:exodeoxyribonuclease-5